VEPPPTTSRPVVLVDELLHADPHGDGVHWSLRGTDEIDMNLVHLDPGSSIAEHRNDVVDVVVVALAGSGRLRLDGEDHPLVPRSIALAARGTHRSIHAGADGLSYLTVHRHRAPLGIGRTRAHDARDGSTDEGGEAPCFAHLLDPGDA
jgi:quercetin dioxygenase-like cupin family protein